MEADAEVPRKGWKSKWYKVRHEFIWWERLEGLKTVAAGRGGDPNVPLRFPFYGPWIFSQRIDYRKNILELEKIQVLRDLGVSWDLKEYYHWNKMYLGLKKITIDKGGDVNISRRVPIYGPWLHEQRIAKQNNKLAPYRIQALRGLGLRW